ncbi:uncharacterized protein LOC130719790 [Lotus japonicus]|uniref:uncharacterized protein LOC130719790 n=1 Tax=Lotus japonicus TaxID=34305 RepID=UPI00258E5A58|nr:uncharacterized protein LOC130719790 [Lotus japonicus]
MLNKHCFEALDITLNDIMKTQATLGHDKLFCEKVVVLGGDIRQILPVIFKGSRSDIVSFAVNSSYLWNHCDETVKPIDEDDSIIEIPSDLLVRESDNPLLELVYFAYHNVVDNLENHAYFEQRALLAPTLERVEEVNNFMMSMIPVEVTKYLSYDTPCRSDKDSEIDVEWFTSKFLNDVKCSGIPNHIIVLKVGVPIMLIRNIDQSAGLCNGTRLIVTALTPYIALSGTKTDSIYLK